MNNEIDMLKEFHDAVYNKTINVAGERLAMSSKPHQPFVNQINGGPAAIQRVHLISEE